MLNEGTTCWHWQGWLLLACQSQNWDALVASTKNELDHAAAIGYGVRDLAELELAFPVSCTVVRLLDEVKGGVLL